MKFKHLFFTLAALACFTTAQAQVKVGANPGTIGSSSSLEVEATNGNKVIVNKNNGTFTIENAPSGDGADSVMTISANGIVRRRNINTFRQAIQVSPYLKTTGTFNKGTTEALNVSYVNNQTVTLQNNITYNASTGEMTVTSSGIYYFGSTSTGPNDLGSGATQNDHCTYIYVNGVPQQQICARSSRFGPSTTNTGIINLSAGDKVRVGLTTASNVNTTGEYSFAINLYKLSERDN